MHYIAGKSYTLCPHFSIAGPHYLHLNAFIKMRCDLPSRWQVAGGKRYGINAHTHTDNKTRPSPCNCNFCALTFSLFLWLYLHLNLKWWHAQPLRRTAGWVYTYETNVWKQSRNKVTNIFSLFNKLPAVKISTTFLHGSMQELGRLCCLSMSTIVFCKIG